jgi:hypothetical protein
VSVEERDWRLNMRIVDGRWRRRRRCDPRALKATRPTHGLDSKHTGHHGLFGAAGTLSLATRITTACPRRRRRFLPLLTWPPAAKTTRHLSRSTPTVDWTQGAATK